tara:strand:+ start:1294 stop:2175 length:882 start_codon:yes stop_codon:yes gene_type:complete
MSDLNKVGIVLQGMPESSNQVSELYKYYTSLGFSNIVISSYSGKVDNVIDNNRNVVKVSYVSDDIQDKTKVIFNDDILANASDSFRRKGSQRGLNQNFQIETTKKGIEYLKDNTDVEYVLKHRLNDCIVDLDKFVLKWIDSINSEEVPSPNYFEKKIVIMGTCGVSKYTCDYWNFGTTNDMWNLWNIPPNTMNSLQAEEYINYCYLLGRDDIKVWSHGDNSLYSNYNKYFIMDTSVREKGYSFKYKNFYIDYSNVGYTESQTKNYKVENHLILKYGDDIPDIIKKFVNNGYKL